MPALDMTDDDLDDVLKEETHRGRRGVVDTEARRLTERVKADYLAMLRDSTEEEVKTLLTSLGRQAGTPEFEAILGQWRAWRRGGR